MRAKSKSVGIPSQLSFAAHALLSYWPGVLVLGSAALARCFVWLNSDVSWLLTFSEVVLTDPTPYADYNETNPPACFLIYLPAILISRIAAVSAEFVVNALVFVGVLACLWIAQRVLSTCKLIKQRHKLAIFVLACAILLILPGDNFAEREHVALIAILPMYCVYAVRSIDVPVKTNLAVLAGIGAGITVAIKPHFIIALILPLFYVAWSSRQRKKGLVGVLFSQEHFAAIFVLLVYGLLIFWRFPDYIDHSIPFVLTLYAPLKYSLWLMLENASVILVVASLLVSLALGLADSQNSLIRVLVLGTVGFTLALIIQGKGWPYHGFPAVALSLLVFSLLLVKRMTESFGTSEGTKPIAKTLALLAAFMFAGIYALASTWFLQEPQRLQRNLVYEVSRLVPAHPKIISIDTGPELAFPLIRKLQGAPTGHQPWQMVSGYADLLLNSGALDPGANRKVLNPVIRRRIEEYARVDRKELADTIHLRRPDAILIANRVLARWAFSDPGIAMALSSYRKAKSIDDVEIWVPR
jgi:hypothetical protein